jgi:ribosome-associated protein
LRFRFTRSSGPGGQNVNKLNTKATLHVEVGALSEAIGPAALGRLRQIAARHLTDAHLVITSEEHRSQGANRRACLAKLRDLIVRARHRTTMRRRTRPSVSSVEKRLRVKRHRGCVKALRRRTATDQ